MAVRIGYLALGTLFLTLAGIGFVTPVMPTTVFCILALWAFKRSSPRMEAWLLNHPVVGSTLQNWEKDHSISLRTKRIAIAMIWGALLLSSFFVRLPVKFVLAAVGVSLTWYLSTRKTAPPSNGRDFGPEGGDSVYNSSQAASAVESPAPEDTYIANRSSQPSQPDEPVTPNG